MARIWVAASAPFSLAEVAYDHIISAEGDAVIGQGFFVAFQTGLCRHFVFGRGR